MGFNAMKIAATGAKGCIGSRLVNLGAESLSCDVTDQKQIRAELRRVKPDMIIHLAAISSADECERDYERAISVNVYGTSNVCFVAEEVLGEGRVVLLSTDQVFDGKTGNHKEQDEPAPVHDYGLTKLSAEGVMDLYDNKIIRISRCFDSQSRDISEYLLRLENNIEIEVPDFIYRNYCHMDYIADLIWLYANKFDDMPSILHLGGSRSVSFFEFMRLVVDDYGYDVDLINPRGERSGFSPRPHKCGLDVSLARKLGFSLPTPLQSIQRMKCESKITS